MVLQNQSEKLKDKLEILLDEIIIVEDDAIRTLQNVDKISNQLSQEAGKII